jgi:alpha-ketoglutarate-dependent taurine dioxygenase
MTEAIAIEVEPATPILLGHSPGQWDAQAITDALQSTGFVLLRNQVRSLHEMEALTRSMCDRFQVHPNIRRPHISSDGLTQEVDPGTHALPPHAELSYTPFYPDTMWFYCVQPPETDGQTTACDGVALLEQLPEDTRRFFENNRIQYNHHYPAQAWQRSLGADTAEEALKRLLGLYATVQERGDLTVQVEADGSLRSKYIRSAIGRSRDGRETFCNSVEISHLQTVIAMRGGTVSMEEGQPVPRAHLTAITRAAERCIVPIQWQAHDILMIDNSRAMHGRRGFCDINRRLYLRMGDRK